jgi:hypothetical protein
VSVLYKFRLDHDLIDKSPLVAAEVASKIARIKDRPDSQDATLATEEVESKEGVDNETLLLDIRGRIGLEEFERLEQHGRDENAIFYLVAADGKRIKLGNESKLMSSRGFAAPVLRWFHKVLPTMKAWQWDAALRLMLKTCTVEEMPDSWESNQMREWLDQYFRERPICDDEGWKEAALHGLPFMEGGDLYLHIEGFMKWVNLTKWGSDGKIDSHVVRSHLKNAGFSHKRRSIWVDGKTYTRSFWIYKGEWLVSDTPDPDGEE